MPQNSGIAIFLMKKEVRAKPNASYFGVGSRIRTDGLQCHKLAL